MLFHSLHLTMCIWLATLPVVIMTWFQRTHEGVFVQFSHRPHKLEPN